MTTIDIVGIGICTVDHLVSVPHFPTDGETIRTDTYLRQSGGLTSSALVAASRLGARTKIIARIGDDDSGHYIRDDLANEGVDTSKLLVEPNTESHISIILVNDATGERTIITRWPTGTPIAPHEISKDDINSAKILFVDTVNDMTMQAVQWAHETGVTIVSDPNDKIEVTKKMLPYINVPIVSEHFAKKWMRDKPPEVVVQSLYDIGASIAIVTLGAQGCIVCSDAGVQNFPAFAVDVVDTTGAGDAFHGAFMVALLQDDWSLAEKVRFASAVAAMNCCTLGGRTGLPTREQVQAFLMTR